MNWMERGRRNRGKRGERQMEGGRMNENSALRNGTSNASRVLFKELM